MYVRKILSIIVCMGCLLVACNQGVVEMDSELRLSFSANSGAEKTVKPLEVFRTVISAGAGDENLKGFEVTENGVKVDFLRIKINGKFIEGNPLIIYPPDDVSLRFTVEITAPSQTGLYDYEFRVFDFAEGVLTINRNITVQAASPTIRYNGPELNIVRKSAEHRYKLNGLKADGKLVSLGVLLAGQPVDVSFLKSFDGKAIPANPFPLDATQADNFDDDLIMLSPSQAGEISYTFVLMDEYGEVGRDSARVLVGEPLVEKVTIDLFNAARDSASGAMNLVTGAVNAASYGEPHILDLGVDTTMMGSFMQWRRQIRASSGLELRYLRNGENKLPQSFSYQFVETKEQVAILFEQNGIVFSKNDVSGNLISDPMQPGMILVAKSGNQYFLIETVLVVDDVSSNRDYYRFNLKR